MSVHEQVLVWVAFVEVVLLGNCAIDLFVVNMQTNAVVGWVQALAIPHVH